MGNSTSTSKDKKENYETFYDVINDIAINYILTMNFQSMKSLANKEYCDNLVILTADIIKRYFNVREIQYLEQKIKDGVEENIMSNKPIAYINKNILDDIDVSNDTMKDIKKKRMCIGIAKYYVKIAHIFSAIVTTINPIYIYNDENGNKIKKTLLEKHTIPDNVSKTLYKLNICDERIKALKREGDIEEIELQDDFVKMNPKICSLNIDSDGNPKFLSDEPGIAELEKLYLDDNYDYSTGNFKQMSPEALKSYENDLRVFYTAFTGEDTMPEYIKRFSDIKLRNYSDSKGCNSNDSPFRKNILINKKNILYVKYAEHIKNMINKATIEQNKLLAVINILFTYIYDPYSNKKKIRINPKLTEKMLQDSVELTKSIIKNLYTTCETDYQEGIKIYEAIIEKQLLETTQNQIKTLKRNAAELITPYINNIDNSTSSSENSNNELPSSLVLPPEIPQEKNEINPNLDLNLNMDNLNIPAELQDLKEPNPVIDSSGNIIQHLDIGLNIPKIELPPVTENNLPNQQLNFNQSYLNGPPLQPLQNPIAPLQVPIAPLQAPIAPLQQQNIPNSIYIPQPRSQKTTIVG